MEQDAIKNMENDFLQEESVHPLLNFVKNKLEKREKLYALVDCSILQGLWSSFEGYDLEYWNLLEEKDADDMEDVAPYLVKLDTDEIGVNWLFNELLGKKAVVLLSSYEFGANLKKNIQKIMNVVYEDGRNVMFRIYNPVILNDIMPFFEEEQIAQVFNTTIFYICESPDANNFIRYSKNNDNKIVSDNIKI